MLSLELLSRHERWDVALASLSSEPELLIIFLMLDQAHEAILTKRQAAWVQDRELDKVVSSERVREASDIVVSVDSCHAELLNVDKDSL